MWRDNGELESYMYYPFRLGDAEGDCGVSWTWEQGGGNTKIEDDTWVPVTMYVKVNTPGVLSKPVAAVMRHI
jgi:hypothetical protein